MEKYDSITKQINTLVKTPEPAGSMFSNLDQQRDLIVKKVSNDYDNQTVVMTVNKQVKDVVGFFKKAFGVSKDSASVNKNKIAHLQAKITDSQSTIDQLGLTEPVIQQLLILVASVAVIYYFGSILGSMVHMIAIIVLVIGLFYIISGTPNNGKSGVVTSIFDTISSSITSRM